MNNVYDGKGRRVGYYHEMSSVIYAHDKNGRNAGYYHKSSNVTFDKNGKRFGTGNLVETLIFNELKNCN
jgi:hypothetical protein